MPIDPVKLLASKFSEDVVDFIFEQRDMRDIPMSGLARYSEYVNVAKVVIAISKGELKPVLLTHSHDLSRMRTHMERENVLMNFPVDFLKARTFSLPNLLRAISYSIMHPLYYYANGNSFAANYAYGSMSRMLENLEDGDFVRKGGLSALNKLATILFEHAPELRYFYKHAPYPW